MRKIGLLLLVLLLGLSTFAAQAQDDGLKAMAQYFPGNTSYLVAVRTDEGYIDQLDALAGLIVNSNLGRLNQAPSVSLRTALNDELQKIGTDLDTVYEWMGDYAAFGVIGEMDTDDSADFDEGYFVVKLKDSEAALDFITPLLPETVTTERDGYYTVFEDDSTDTYMAIGNNLLLIYPEDTGLPEFPLTSPLSEQAGYQGATAQLSADPYNILLYLRPTLFTSDDPTTTMLLQSSGSLAVGFTMLDDRSLVIDSAQMPNANGESAAVPGVNPDFARYIPANASFVLHANSLTNLYENFINLAEFGIAMDGGSEDPAQQIREGLETVGIDLDEDILSWTTGDFAVFSRLDTLAFIKGATTGTMPDFANNFDFGFVMEATDADKAAAFAETITRLLRFSATQEEGMTLSTETMNGITVTVLSGQMPTVPGETTQIDILMGANDAVFFIATRSAAEIILNGDGTLVNNPAYLEAQEYFLPDTASVWFADGPGLVGMVGISTVSALAVIGPAIGDVFDEMVTELGGTTSDIPTPVPPMSPFGDFPPDFLTTQFRAAFQLVTSSSITSAITDEGVTQIRVVLTLNDEPGTLAIPDETAVIETPEPVPAIVIQDYSDVPTERLADGGFVLGEPDVPVTLVEFLDFACPHCQANKPTIDEFIATYVRTGQARYEMRIMPTAGGPVTYSNGSVAVCLDAQQEGAYWQAREWFFERAVAGEYNSDTAELVTERLGLDYQTALECSLEEQQIQNDVLLAQELGIGGTPTLLVRYGDSEPVFIEQDGTVYDGGAIPFEVLSAIVEAAQGNPS